MPKRKCTFNSALQQGFPFIKRAASCDHEVICNHCGVKFSVAHGGRSDVNDHLKSGKHIKCVQAKSSKGMYLISTSSSVVYFYLIILNLKV